MPIPTPDPDPARPQAALDTLRQKQQRLLEGLADSQRQFKHLARSVYQVQEAERRRLARELHDGIGQSLTALKHRLAALAASSGAEAPELAGKLGDAVGLCAAILEDTRALSRLLRPQILDDLGLEPALSWLARSVAESGGPAVETACDLAGLTPDPEIATLLFRAAQESLANAQKHAGARHVQLRVWREPGRLVLLVRDDGRGFEPQLARAAASRGESSGLSGLADRVRVYDGHMHIRTAPGQGCEIRVEVPCVGAMDAVP
jgi:signal transduction histidine kinase